MFIILIKLLFSYVKGERQHNSKYGKTHLGGSQLKTNRSGIILNRIYAAVLEIISVSLWNKCYHSHFIDGNRIQSLREYKDHIVREPGG